ncbi:class IV adenylate cyclase [Mangrovihabitans endophyticus]|uniref:Adenylyl cyclase n=1 Tax=Mangrovihabitans endophyticus TaxID=1751298 RepID=A0A8J3C394_9ACTN|nr:class IV adenylate cyclase [Mangrovihabitans endophyticus]GGL01824.1 adenylyl cyclase [Mangrovihabitans endophyticus]
MKYIEIEQKFAVPDAEALRTALAARHAKPGTATRQVDTYYNAPHRDFLAPAAISEWLRIRRQDGGDASLNFKRWHPIDADVKTHADEYETPVTDPEAVRLTLEALDFTVIAEVDKTREEWHLDGDVPTVVAIDTIDGLGTFAEFEFKGEAESPGDAIDQLTSLIESLKVPLGDRINLGYPHLILGREK